MKFSLITPTLNSGKYLEELIQSIFCQDYTNWEHIIIDGSSADQTLTILNKYPHLRWISEADNGIYHAMNKGLKMAKGDWICFLGADDQLKPGVLNKIAELIKKSDCDVMYGDVNSPRFGGRYGGEFDAKRLYQNNICHQSIFFNKRVFMKVKNFNLKYKSHADWDHNLRWMLNSEIKSQYTNLVIAEYADGGFSSLNHDEIFARDKRFNYIKYGWRTSDKKFVEMQCKQEILEKNLFVLRKFFAAVILVLIRTRSFF